MTGQNPAKGVVGGEGDLGEKEEEAEPHPWVPVACRERVGGDGSAEHGGRRRSALTEMALWWKMVDEKRSTSCARARRI